MRTLPWLPIDHCCFIFGNVGGRARSIFGPSSTLRRHSFACRQPAFCPSVLTGRVVLLHRPEPIFSNQPRHPSRAAPPSPQKANQRRAQAAQSSDGRLESFLPIRDCRGRRPEAPADPSTPYAPEARRAGDQPVHPSGRPDHQPGGSSAVLASFWPFTPLATETRQPLTDSNQQPAAPRSVCSLSPLSMPFPFSPGLTTYQKPTNARSCRTAILFLCYVSVYVPACRTLRKSGRNHLK